MDKPRIIEYFEPQIRYEISQAVDKDENRDYYSYFIDFLEEKKKITLVQGNVVGLQYKSPKQVGGGGIINIPFGIDQIEYGIKYLKNKQKEEKGITIAEQGTARQIALAWHYMQKGMIVPRKTGTNILDAEFVRFLTGKDLKKIKDTFGNPLKRKSDETGKGTSSLIDDLIMVLNQFKQIHFSEGVKLVDNDIKTLQNDLESFKEI